MPRSDNNITAKIIADSKNRHGIRLTTFVVTFPRIILAELNTHRMLSRSVASSRAIPIRKQIEKVRSGTFYPSWVGRAESGMQSNSEVDAEIEDRFKQEWLLGASVMCGIAETMDKMSIHKQIVNRLLEPYGYVTAIVSGTDFANFFKLRAHKDAQPEFQALAFKMLAAYVDSEPENTDEHIPFGDAMEPGLSTEEKRLIACARCARISYENHEGNRDPKKDLELASRLIESGHLSPFEHVARTHINDTYVGNFRGWTQYRKMIQNENIVKLDYEKLLLTRPTWI